MQLHFSSFRFVVLCACTVTVLFLCHSGTEAFRTGDTVKIAQRSRVNDEETGWNAVIAQYAPRFRYDKQALLPNQDEMLKSSNFKISFSFDEGAFLTPWITVWEAKTKKLINSIEIVFIYSGDDIKEVKYYTDYNDEPEHLGRILPYILLKYTWEEYGELDTDTSMYGLLICGFFSSLTLVGYVLVDLSRSHKDKSGSAAHLMRAVDSFSFDTPAPTPFAGDSFQSQLPRGHHVYDTARTNATEDQPPKPATAASADLSDLGIGSPKQGDFEGYSADHRHPVLEGKGNGKEEEEAEAGGGDDHQANHHDGGDDVIGEFVNAGAHEASIVSSTPVYLQQPLSASHHRKKNKNKEKTEKDD